MISMSVILRSRLQSSLAASACLAHFFNRNRIFCKYMPTGRNWHTYGERAGMAHFNDYFALGAVDRKRTRRAGRLVKTVKDRNRVPPRETVGRSAVGGR